VTSADIAWVERISLNFDVRIEQSRSVVIRKMDCCCHALGYVGEISPEQLKQPDIATRLQAR